MLSGFRSEGRSRTPASRSRVDRPGVGQEPPGPLRDRRRQRDARRPSASSTARASSSRSCRPRPGARALVVRSERTLFDQRRRQRAHQEEPTFARAPGSLSLLARRELPWLLPGLFTRSHRRQTNHFTWGVLKAHTRNTADGEVRLRSKDPRDRPEIDFHYFDEGSPGGREDLEAVVEGVVTVRRVMKRLGAEVVREVSPGPAVETREQICASFVSRPRLGTSRLVHQQDRPGERSDVRRRQPLQGARHPRPPRRRRLGLPTDPGLLHRRERLHR